MRLLKEDPSPPFFALDTPFPFFVSPGQELLSSLSPPHPLFFPNLSSRPLLSLLLPPCRANLVSLPSLLIPPAPPNRLAPVRPSRLHSPETSELLLSLPRRLSPPLYTKESVWTVARHSDSDRAGEDEMTGSSTKVCVTLACRRSFAAPHRSITARPRSPSCTPLPASLSLSLSLEGLCPSLHLGQLVLDRVRAGRRREGVRGRDLAATHVLPALAAAAAADPVEGVKRREGSGAARADDGSGRRR